MFTIKNAPVKLFISKWGIFLLALYFGLTGFLLLQNIYVIWPSSLEKRIDTFEFLRDYELIPGTERIKVVKNWVNRPFAALDDSQKAELDKTNNTLDSMIKHSTHLAKSMRRFKDNLDTVNKHLDEIHKINFKVLWWDLAQQKPLSRDTILLLIVILLGALGSWVHATSSFLDYTGNRNFVTSWTVWYMMRPMIGSMLAVIFYVVIRAGFFPNGTIDVNDINIYSIAAVSALVGLFTQRAAKKLADVFDAIFPVQQKDKDPITATAIKITSITPEEVEVGKPQNIVVLGEEFTSGCKASINEEFRICKVVSNSKLEVTLLDKDVKEVGELQIVIKDSTPAAGATEAILTVKVIKPVASDEDVD